MAIPKTLRPISKDDALELIRKHEKDGTGHWESSPMYSDFVYYGRMTRYGRRLEMIRPGLDMILPGCEWEIGVVSL